jgi:hypothetical protein
MKHTGIDSWECINEILILSMSIIILTNYSRITQINFNYSVLGDVYDGLNVFTVFREQ